MISAVKWFFRSGEVVLDSKRVLKISVTGYFGPQLHSRELTYIFQFGCFDFIFMFCIEAFSRRMLCCKVHDSFQKNNTDTEQAVRRYGVICDSSKMLLVRLHTLLDNLRSPTKLFINREKDVQMQFFFLSAASLGLVNYIILRNPRQVQMTCSPRVKIIGCVEKRVTHSHFSNVTRISR